MKTKEPTIRPENENSIFREKWMNDDQWECAQMAADFMGGFHHLSYLRKWGPGIAIDHPNELATFDFSGLTRLVIMAHERCIRVGIDIQTRTETYEGQPYEESYLFVSFHKRLREGRMSKRHPTLEELVRELRSREGVHAVTDNPMGSLS